MTNVKVEWEAVNSDGFGERVNLVMASDDMPDAILKGVPDITKCSADGSVVDLTELLKKYAPGINRLFEEAGDPGRGLIARRKYLCHSCRQYSQSYGTQESLDQ